MIGDEFEGRFVIDLDAQTYSVFVAGEGGERVMARDFGFRTQAQGTSSLTHFVTFSGVGSVSEGCVLSTEAW